MKRPVILLTGFEPFGGAGSNPSWEAVQQVKADWQEEAALHIACLPVVFAEAAERIDAMITLLEPDIVVATGLAEGRAAMAAEVIAINRIDARIPDNDGMQPRDVPVSAPGPDGLFSTLPVKPMVKAMLEVGVPAGLSYSAGTFVCNSTFYKVVAAQSRHGGMGGFIHVPATPDMVERADCPTMSVEVIATGLHAALMACLRGDRDAPSLETGTIA
ncbi:MAG: pyroglutamyl-peptidase I [Pelagibacterium sp. SCN 63-23]|nr:MAG: pyroglutamyl-peptidase I [Pelagibacterium sp. SCN 63-23]